MTYKEHILSLPITTNRLDVSIDKKSFFEKYSIIRYCSVDKEYKNLAYEQLGNAPCISVTGIKARWIENRAPYVQFFILTFKEEAFDVLDSLRKYNTIKSGIDTLDLYDENLQKRIIASLAINSLGKKKNNRLMYHNGALLVRDDTNFDIRKSIQELVCLKIEINEFMNLTAKTNSFTHPKNFKELARHKNCVFHEGKYIVGCLWSGEALKPILIDLKKIEEYKLEDLYIKKRKHADKTTTVPYWPYNKEKYMKGKIFVISQIVESVNKSFKDTIQLGFHDYQVWIYDEYESSEDIEKLIKDSLAGKTIRFNDPFNTKGSSAIINHLKESIKNELNQEIHFSTISTGDEMIIKLCEPEKEELQQTHYLKSQDRINNGIHAIQHVIYDTNDKENTIKEPAVKRILLELMVKDFIIHKSLPAALENMLKDWECIQYKIKDEMVYGASLKIENDHKLNIRPIGIGEDTFGEDFDIFARTRLRYEQVEKIKGNKDYRVMIKASNTYLIVDTEEIPVLDAKLIDEGYQECIYDNVTISKFRRKGLIHDYLRGFVGFRMWKSEGLDSCYNLSYSYLSGKFWNHEQISTGKKMEKMPRTRKIFVLHADNADIVEKDILEIAAMLKLGFGRWNEIMTYPFPFKILYEYLDDLSLQAYGIHWNNLEIEEI